MEHWFRHFCFARATVKCVVFPPGRHQPRRTERQRTGHDCVLGHELGHAIIRQLNLPLTGMEEDSADGFATFFTVNDKDTGSNTALGAAVLFDAIGSKRPNLTLEDFSSDHPVILQRVYNFLCCVVGSDPQRLKNSLVTDGYIPEVRALLCRKEWTQLNYG